MGMLRFYFTAASSPFFVTHMLCKFRKFEKHPEKFSEEERFQFAKDIMYHMKKRSRTETVVTGMENLPKDGGYIMYANHQGKYDAIGILLAYDKPCAVLMEKKQSERIVARQVIDLVGGIRLDFDDPRQQMKALTQLGDEVKNGKRFLIFPEGKWGDNKNTLQEFHSGCFRCSLQSKTPIVPVAIVDSYKGLNTNSLKKCTTYVHFLKPIYFEEYGNMKKNELSALVKERIQEKIDEELAKRSAGKENKNA